MAAVVQGMDETVVNGAQIYYAEEFGLQPPNMSESQASWIVGLINSSPYLACAVLGCWLTGPLNNILGRRGVIFLSCFVAGGTAASNPSDCSRLHLGGCLKFLGQPLHCAFCAWSRDRIEVDNCSRLQCRNIACPHPRSTRYDVADVDCLRYHAGLYRRRRSPRCP